MEKENRRDFVKKIMALSALSLIPSPVVYALSPSKSVANSRQELLNLLSKARKKYLAGNYKQCVPLYTDITNKFPNDLRAYYGLRKTFKQLKEPQKAFLTLQQALKNNPSSGELWVSYAKEIHTIKEGNKKLYKSLELSNQIEKEAIATAVEKAKNLKLNGKSSNIDKFEERVKFSATIKKITTDRKDSKKLRKIKKQRKVERLKGLTFSQKSSKLLKKEKKKLSQNQLRSYYDENKTLIELLEKEKKYDEAKKLAISLYKENKADGRFLRAARKNAKKTKDYKSLLEVNTLNHLMKNNCNTYAAVIKAQFLLFKNNQLTYTQLNKAIDEGYGYANSVRTKLEFDYKKVQINLLSNKLIESHSCLQQMVENAKDNRTVDVWLRINRAAIAYYHQNNERNKAVVLSLSIGNPSLTSEGLDDVLLKQIIEKNKNLTIEKLHHQKLIEGLKNYKA